MESPIWNIEGEKIALGPRRRDLNPTYLRWMNDFEVVRTLSAPLLPRTLESQESWYDESKDDPRNTIFTIFEKATKRAVGNAGLHAIDQRHRTAVFGIVIGEKDCWGKGYGTEATRLVLDYAFTAAGLHAVSLHVDAENVRGQRAYARAGFKLVGRLRESRRVGTTVQDSVVMDCLASEFESPVLRKILEPKKRS